MPINIAKPTNRVERSYQEYTEAVEAGNPKITVEVLKELSSEAKDELKAQGVDYKKELALQIDLAKKEKNSTVNIAKYNRKRELPVSEGIASKLKQMFIGMLKDSRINDDNKDYLPSVVLLKWANMSGAKVITMSETQKKYGTDMDSSDIVDLEEMAKETYKHAPIKELASLNENQLDDLSMYLFNQIIL